MTTSPNPIAPDEVLIVLAAPAQQSDEDVEAAWSVLDAEERARAARFALERDRIDFVVAHGLLRRVLARCTGQTARALQFSVGAHGRPELAPRGVRFSLSHTRGLVGCAITAANDVGFDIEAVRAPAPLEMAEQVFTAAERLALEGRPPQQRDDHFYALWTLKESYIKGRGMGLALPLHSFTVDPLPEGEARLRHEGVGDGVGDGTGPWTLRHWRFAEHHAALAVRVSAAALRIRIDANQRLASMG